jgi:hypothetical protein
VTANQALNRGYNLMVGGILVLAGLAFGTVGFSETDLPDKLDDFGLLAVGVVALVWYLIGSNRFKRSLVPFALVVVALVVQVVGVYLEVDDKEAFGDNIGGMFLFLPSVVFTGYQYWRTGKLSATEEAAPAASEETEDRLRVG